MKQKVTGLYLAYLMIFFVLYCGQGFYFFDYNKRDMFVLGSVIYICTLCLASLKGLRLRKPTKTEILMAGLLAVWSIGALLATNTEYALVGDPYRSMGLVYMGTLVVSAWLVSKNVCWNDVLEYMVLATSAVVYILQLCNHYWFDPLNFTDGWLSESLISTLGNLNQNACFNLLMIAILGAMFILSDNRKKQLAYGINIILACMALYASRSVVAIAGMLIIFMACVAVGLAKPDKLWRVWHIGTFFCLGSILQAIGMRLCIAVNGSVLGGYGPDTSELMPLGDRLVFGLVSLPGILIMIAVVALTGILLRKGKMAGKAALKPYLAVCGILISAGIIVLAAGIITANSNSGFANFMYQATSHRTAIWNMCLKMFLGLPLSKILFGIGLNNLCVDLPRICEAEYYSVFSQGEVLADAHSIYIDILVSSGIIGFACYFGIIYCLLKRLISALMAGKEKAIIGLLALIVYLAAGLVNSNMIVVTVVLAMAVAVNGNQGV